MDTLWPGKTKRIVCPRCDGAGEYDVPHPSWGSPSCPEPYLTRRCRDCDGEGRLIEPVRETEPPGEEDD